MKRALIVKQPYADMIISGQKNLEMRSKKTNVRGEVGIIPKGSGHIIGTVEVVGVHDFSHAPQHLKNPVARSDHRIPPEEWHLLDKWCIGWELRNPRKFVEPIKYDHPQGAVTWVRI